MVGRATAVVLAAAGTTTVMLVALAAEIVAGAPPMVTVVAPTIKRVPVIVRLLPATPAMALSVEMLGGSPFTVKPPTPPATVTAPPCVVIDTAVGTGAKVPPARSAGMTAVMVVSFTTVNDAAA